MSRGRPRHNISETKTPNTQNTDAEGRFKLLGNALTSDRNEHVALQHQAGERALAVGNLEAFEDIQKDLKKRGNNIDGNKHQGDRGSTLLQDSRENRISQIIRDRQSQKTVEQRINKELVELLRKEGVLREEEILLLVGDSSLSQKQGIINRIASQPDPQLADIRLELMNIRFGTERATADETFLEEQFLGDPVRGIEPAPAPGGMLEDIVPGAGEPELF